MKHFLAQIWKKLGFPKNVQLKIMRFFQDEFLIGTTGVIFNNKNEVLVCNHTYRDGERWSLPGGYMKSKEHPSEGLAREIEEEMGLIIQVDKELRIRTDRETARIDITLVGHYVGGEFKPSHEVSQAGFFAFDNLPRLSKNQLLLIQEVLEDKKKRK